MEKNLLMKLQKYLTVTYLLSAVVTLVFALGFITKYYGLYLYLSRVKVAIDFYKNVLQPFNKEIFNSAIIFILLALIMFLFEFNKYRVGILGLALSFITTIIVNLHSLSYLTRLKEIKAQYLAIDISKAGDKYSYSTITFDLGGYIYIGIMIVSILLSFIVLLNFLSNKKNRGITQYE